MAKTIRVSSDTLKRFNWYKEKENHADADVLLNFLMTACGVPSLDFIEHWEQSQRKALQREMKKATAEG